MRVQTLGSLGYGRGRGGVYGGHYGQRRGLSQFSWGVGGPNPMSAPSGFGGVGLGQVPLWVWPGNWSTLTAVALALLAFGGGYVYAGGKLKRILKPTRRRRRRRRRRR